MVRETWTEIRESPAPPDRARFGCPAAILGLSLLVAWPRFGALVPGGEFASPFILLAGVILLLGGPAMALLGRGGASVAAHAAAEAAMRRLEDPASDRETAIRAATVLVAHAFTVQGPTTVATFDVDEIRPRLGERTPLVIAVEEHLVGEGWAYPAFSPAPDEG